MSRLPVLWLWGVILYAGISHGQSGPGKGPEFQPAEGRAPAGVRQPPEGELDKAMHQKSWAILIGINRYEDEQGIGSLRYCVADMKLLHSVLTGPSGGFDPDRVLMMTDDALNPLYRPTYTNIVRMVPRWLQDPGPEDDVLVAFSGHGIEAGGDAYLLPSTAVRSALRLTAVSLSLLRDWLDASRAPRKVLVLDACHSGAGRDVAAMSEAFAEDLERGHGFVRLASCGPHQKSNEAHDLGHGVFIYYLVEALRGPGDLDRDGRIDVDEAYRYTYAQVRRWARLKGLRQDPLKSGSVSGVMTLAHALPPRKAPEEAESEAKPPKAPRPAPPPVVIPPFAEWARGRVTPSSPNAETDALTAWPKRVRNALTMDFVLIPPMTFSMGDESHADSTPKHLVRIRKPFYFADHETTVGEFRRFLVETKYAFPHSAWEGPQGLRVVSPTDEHPMANLTWTDAVAFCAWLTRKDGVTCRLPTESEWEYACRGPDADGTPIPQAGNFRATGGTDRWPCAAPVRRFAPNSFGLFDMLGNVWEWCGDWYGPYGKEEDIDPTGAAWGTERVARGGSWLNDAYGSWATLRSRYAPSFRSPTLGFRVVLAPCEPLSAEP